jgi:hypothetical protein
VFLWSKRFNNTVFFLSFAVGGAISTIALIWELKKKDAA